MSGLPHGSGRVGACRVGSREARGQGGGKCAFPVFTLGPVRVRPCAFTIFLKIKCDIKI